MAGFSIERLWSAAMTGYKAFRQAYVASDQGNLKNFASWDARKLRYSLNWAMYENTAYDSVHTWATSYKSQLGLYEFTRGIYNPSFRLGEFWRSHLLAGPLDMDAGDGIEKPSALPIVTTDSNLRKAIGQAWAWSQWQRKKDIFGIWTPVLGDGILQVVDDLPKGRVYIKVVHPSKLKELVQDEFGNVKGYTYQYNLDDPRAGKSGEVLYTEIAYRDGEKVVYETYLGEQPYAYGPNPAKWEIKYGFVPMVFLKHNDVGLDFGWSVLHPGLPKFRETDDQASKLNDQVRRMVEGAWLMAGVTPPKKKVVSTSSNTQTDEEKQENPQAAREEMKLFYATDANAKAHTLVGDLDIAATAENIQNLIKELERDFPELRLDLANAGGDISGKALRLNRSPAESRVLLSRPNYDDAIVRAHQMAIAIAGYRRYKGFEAFGLDSFAAGKLDHQIGDRPVFPVDPILKLEEDSEFWAAANKAKAAGVPLDAFLRLQNWPEDKINNIIQSEEYQARLEASRLALEAQKSAVSGDGFNQDRSKRKANPQAK
jgi:hypothetical protein